MSTTCRVAGTPSRWPAGRQAERFTGHRPATLQLSTGRTSIRRHFLGARRMLAWSGPWFGTGLGGCLPRHHDARARGEWPMGRSGSRAAPCAWKVACGPRKGFPWRARGPVGRPGSSAPVDAGQHAPLGLAARRSPPRIAPTRPRRVLDDALLSVERTRRIRFRRRSRSRVPRTTRGFRRPRRVTPRSRARSGIPWGTPDVDRRGRSLHVFAAPPGLQASRSRRGSKMRARDHSDSNPTAIAPPKHNLRIIDFGRKAGSCLDRRDRRRQRLGWVVGFIGRPPPGGLARKQPSEDGNKKGEALKGEKFGHLILKDVS